MPAVGEVVTGLCFHGDHKCRLALNAAKENLAEIWGMCIPGSLLGGQANTQESAHFLMMFWGPDPFPPTPEF